MLGVLSSASKLQNIRSATYHGHASASILIRSARLLSSEVSFTDDDNVSPDSQEIKSGTVYSFDRIKKYGFIKPDGLNNVNSNWNEMIFFHSVDIKTIPLEGENVSPHLSINESVEFKTEKASSGKKTNLKACEITLKGGRLARPFSKNFLPKYIQNQKAYFGDRVFDAMDKVSDEHEMEKSIVDAFQHCNNNIERQKARIERIEGVYSKAKNAT